MSAVLALIDETTRLYTRQSPLPVDVIAPQHREIHSDLERWGSWNRERYRPRTANSAEGDYRRTRAGDQGTEYPRLPVALPVNVRNQSIDRTVIALPMQHRKTVVMFYAERRSPSAICRAVVIRPADFGRWMFDCRAMVINLLRFTGA